MGCSISNQGFTKDQHIDNAYRGSFYRSLKSIPTERGDEYFSDNEKKILRKTWDILAKDKEKHGIAIFICIFEKMPVTKQLFPFRDVEHEELMSNVLFRSHAKRFMHAVESTIPHFDAL